MFREHEFFIEKTHARVELEWFYFITIISGELSTPSLSTAVNV